MVDLPLVVSDVCRWYAATSLALGERTGLLGALLDGPGSAADLAARARVDRRNAEVWANAMVVAGYASLDGDRFIADEQALGVLRGGLAFDFRAAVGVLAPIGGLLPRVEQAIQDGEGIGSEEIQNALGMLPELVNVPMYRKFLVDEWIVGHPDVRARLEAGIDVAEIGPGGGEALRILARAFPASRFVGYDLDPTQVARANASAGGEGLPKLRFEALDATRLPASSYDLVCVFDAFHHFTQPAAVLEAVRTTLREGGSFLVAEASLSGDPTSDAADPTAMIMYGCDLVYCFQESAADSGAGLGATWSGGHLERFLADHGFRTIASTTSEAGYTLTRAVPAAQR